MTPTTTHDTAAYVYVMRIELMSNDDIRHPSFSMPNAISEKEYQSLTETQKTYYIKVD